MYLKSDSCKVARTELLPSCKRGSLLAIVLLIMVQFALAQSVSAQPQFSKVFEPDIIETGSVSTLTFNITNDDQALTNIAFSDVLPTGVTIAAVANAHAGCGGTLTAPAGGGTITQSGGMVAGPGSCSISVDVTSNTIGTHMNVTSNITHSAGEIFPVSDDLTVVPKTRIVPSLNQYGLAVLALLMLGVCLVGFRRFA